MANEVLIEVKANTKEAQKDLKDLKSKFTNATSEAGGLSKGFGALGKSMLAFGVGALGGAFALNKVIDVIGAVAKSEASLEFTLARLPPIMQQTFGALEDELETVGADFGVTARQAKAAFATILSVSRNPTLGLLELEAQL